MPGPRNRTIEKPKDAKNTLKRMVKEFKKEIPLIVVVILLSIASAVLTLYSPILLKDILSQKKKK